jgi:hypothetical protein
MIRDIRRGHDPASIEITARDGSVLHIIADGFTADEVRRHREELVSWFVGSGIPCVDEEARRQ